MNLLSFNNGIEIVVSSNRENVKLCVKKVTDDIAKNFSWLAKEIEMNGVACPRKLLYVNDYKSCGEIFSFFMHTLGNKAYWPRDGTEKSTNRIVAMFHSVTADKIKEHVLSSLKDAQGNVRIVIATSALGMGVNIKGLHHIIHYGPPSDIESYVQGFGRAGRDGMDSEALVLFHGRQLRLCEPEMLDFVKCDTCRRVKSLAFFDDTGDNRGIVPKHLCCDICARDCECGETECNNYEKSMFLLMSKATGTTKENYVQKRDVSEAQRKKA